MIKRRMPRSSSCTRNDIFALRGKFNSILEDRLQADGNGQHIISIQVPEVEFDLLGNLNEIRKITFWHEINRGLRKFDMGEITLKPRKSQQKGESPRPAHQGYRKLPTPPLKRGRSRDTGSSKHHELHHHRDSSRKHHHH